MNKNFNSVLNMDSMEILEEFKTATIELHEHPDSAKAQKRLQDVELEIYIRMNYRES